MSFSSIDFYLTAGAYLYLYVWYARAYEGKNIEYNTKNSW